LSDPENGFPEGVRITQSQASAQRFGYAQIIEGRFCKDLRGKSGVFVPRVRVSNSQAVRYAILGWTSTEDAVTSDVVNDWTSSTYTAGNFFLASNVSVVAVGSVTPSANTWTSLTALTGSMGTTFNNVICMVWTEGTAAQNFTLDFDYNQFEEGATATPFETHRPDELQLCQRYFWRVTGAASNSTVLGMGVVDAVGTSAPISWNLRVPMRTVPTVSSSGTIQAYDGNSLVSLSSVALNSSTNEIITIQYNLSAALIAGRAVVVAVRSGATIDHSSEL